MVALKDFFSWATTRVAPGVDNSDEQGVTSSEASEEFDLKGDQFPEMANAKLKLQWWDLWALGFAAAAGGHFYFWNIPYLAGFGHFIIAYFLVASAYGTLALCMAELSSALPFAGGAYGISRVTLGTLMGFLVGCFDTYQSMFNALYSSVAIGGIITIVWEMEEKWLPLWWFIILFSYFIFNVIGGPWMWRLIRLMSFTSLLMIFIYIFGSIQFADFKENVALWYPFGLEGRFQYFHGGVDMFLSILPFTCWIFAGTNSVNLAAHDCVNPKRDVPRGYILTWVTVFCTSLAIIFVGASVPPGATFIAYFFFPESVSYALIFDMTIQKATALCLPAVYTTGFAMTYYYGSQIRAMGKSGLANPWLGYDIPGFKTPVVALIFGLIVTMLVGLRYYEWRELDGESLLSLSLMGATVVYMSQFASFIVLRLYYPQIKREFVSPLGIAGAVYGFLVFALVFLTLTSIYTQTGLSFFAIFLGALLVYYFLVVRHRQVFSEEEKTVLFKAYLLKSNRSRNERLRTGIARYNFYRTASADEEAGSSQASRVKPSPMATGSLGSSRDGGSKSGSVDDRNSLRSVRSGARNSARGTGTGAGLGLDAAYAGLELGAVPTVPEEVAGSPSPDAHSKVTYFAEDGASAVLPKLSAVDLGNRGTDLSLYEAPHCELADVLQEPNPNVY